MAVESLWVEPERAEIKWAALEFNDVFKIYGEGAGRTVALRGLDLRVEPREMVAIVGPSGSGKSTALTLAAGLDIPSAGEVRAGGDSLSLLDEAGLARHRARRVALVFQGDNLWPELTARENLIAALRLAGVADPGGRAASSLEALGLAERADHLPRELSGGEQQRVAIAGAAARRAPLVLADEPTGELDRRNEEIVLAGLRDLRDAHDSTVVVVTHSADVASACDRVVEIHDGRAA